MRLIITIFSILSFSLTSVSQNLIASYKISKDVFYENEAGIQKRAASLEYKGLFFQKANKYLFYKKPLYLSEYPAGTIDINNGSHNVSLALCTDTLQGISFRDLDSLIWRYRNDISGTGVTGLNYVRNFRLGIQKWELLEETKKINGLNCQRAKLAVNGNLIWDVWFTPDINILVGPVTIIDIPGLVVEANCIPLNEKYILESYRTDIDVSEAVLWPNEFNQPFKRLKSL